MLPQGDATNITWLMHGPLPFMGKIMHVFINMDVWSARILKSVSPI
jgi:hypothetical protein